MKKKMLVLFAVIAFFIVGIIGINVNISTNPLSQFVLANIEALAQDEIIDGGELPGATIKCDTGGSGTCYSISVDRVYADGRCHFTCAFTGYQNDSCSAFWVGLINFCTSLG